MTQQLINVGVVANDGTGDPARTAFQKVNSNFTELYGLQVAYADSFTTTAGQTTFTLSANPGSLARILVSLDGSTLVPTTDYTWSAPTTLTLTASARVGQKLLAQYSSAGTLGVDDSAAVQYTQGSTGAVTRTVQKKLQERVSVLDFGADPTGATDSTAAMQAAHNTGSIVYYPAGTYLFTRLATSIANGGIIGDGPTRTVLKSTDTSSNDLMVFSGVWQDSQVTENNAAFTFRDFSMECPLAITKTGGAGIKITATATFDNQSTSFYNCLFRTMPIGINFATGSFWTVIGCRFVGCAASGGTGAGIKVANAYNADSGDGVISNCVFETNPVPNTYGVWQQSSGGLKVIGNKFLGGSVGYLLDYQAPTGNPTSDLIIMGNSMELMQVGAIGLTRTLNAATFINIVISGNQIAIVPVGIYSDSSTFMSEVTITGNAFSLLGSGSPYAIGLNFVTDLVIAGNTIRGNGGTSNGISLVSCTNARVGPNLYANLTTPYALGSPTKVVIAQDYQAGTATTGTAGYVASGSLFISALQTVTFPVAFQVAPSITDVSIVGTTANGTIAAVVISVSASQFTFYAITSVTGIAAPFAWKVWGTL